MKYSFSYLEPVCCSMSSSNWCFLTCILVSQEAGQVLWYSHLFQNFPQFIGILSRVQLFATPWPAACQTSLSITNSQSLLKLKSNESVMPSNHPILSRPLLLLAFNLSQHQGLLKWVSSSHQVAKVLEFQLQHQSFQWMFRTYFL